jgi:hypothetical protein
MMGLSTLEVMKPWQTSLNKAPSKGGKEGTKRERERERERKPKSKPEELLI